MFTRRVAYWAALAALPLLVAILWLASGREVLTKHWRSVSVVTTDELFGDTTVVQQFKPGPIFGYYVGLDLVIVAAFLSLVVAGVVWLTTVLARHRAAREEPV